MSVGQTADAATTVDPAEQRALLESRTAKAVELALAAGATDAEAIASSSARTNVTIEKGDLQLARSNTSEALGLRVFIGPKMGFAYTNQFSGSGLESLAADAVALARMSPPDEIVGLAKTGALGSNGDLVDSDAWNTPIESIVAGAEQLLDGVRAGDQRIALESSEFAASRSSVAIHSSAGAAASESDAGLSFSLFGMAIDGDDVGSFDYVDDWMRSPNEIDARMAKATHEFVDAVVGSLGAGTAETYKGAVLFSPEAFTSLFLQPLIGAMSAKSVQRGRSALADKLGQAVGAKSFTLIDDPGDRGLAGASQFDREGLSARRTELVSAGVLRTFLHNSYTARVADCASTGHAAGGTRSVPGIGPHAVSMAPGDGGDRTALTKQLDRSLLVGRFSGTVDPISGDFSGVAKSSRWIENGEVVRSVGETLLAGNAYECLQTLAAIGSTAELLSGSMRVPWVLVDGVSVTAG